MLTEHDKDKFVATTMGTVIGFNMLTHMDDPKLGAAMGRIESAKAIDASKARIIHGDGRVNAFDDERMAVALYHSLPKGCQAAFRGKNDFSPVHAWDCVDKP